MTNAQPKPNRMFRDEANGVIAGIATGMAEYFDMDVTLVRVIFALLLFMSGGTIIPFYIFAWIIIPDKHSLIPAEPKSKTLAESATAKTKSKSSSSTLINNGESVNKGGLVLILIGGFFLLSNYGFLDWLDFSKLWPVVLILLGLYILNRKDT